MIGCGGAPKVQVDADYAARGGRAEVGETTAQPEEPPHGTRAPVRTPAPLPDGWPREPIEPLPLKKRHWTVMDAHDPIARLVRDFNEPGELRIELTTRKAKGFKATVQLHDSFGETLFEAVLRDRLTIGPRAIVPGTLYLLVRREGGLAELGIKTTYAAEHYDGIH
jgi:hypothetical protein